VGLLDRDDGDRYHLFFLKASRPCSTPTGGTGVPPSGTRRRPDLTTWTEHADAVIPDDSPAFDDLATWTGSVVRDDAELWRMFYTAVEPGRGRTQPADQLGRLRRSAHLAPRTRPAGARAGRPLVRDGRRPGVADQAWRDPWVFQGQDGWHMLITARATTAIPTIEA
jgi:beta-fructofuranosidase